MRLSGWIFMITYWTLILTVLIYSFGKILTKQDKKRKNKSFD